MSEQQHNLAAGAAEFKLNRIILSYWTDCDTYTTCSSCGAEHLKLDQNSTYLYDTHKGHICHECAEKHDPTLVGIWSNIRCHESALERLVLLANNRMNGYLHHPQYRNLTSPSEDQESSEVSGSDRLLFFSRNLDTPLGQWLKKTFPDAEFHDK
jgi:hypothetical protein